MATATWDKQNRGREANKPSEIPAKGWKDTLMRVKKEMGEDNLSMISAAMSFYALLAFVPAITSMVLIYAWFSDPSQISQHIASVSNVLPKEMQEILKGQLTALTSKADSALGFGAIVSLLFSLWSASKGSTALIDALNIIYDEKEERGFFKKTGLALGFTLLATLMAILAIGIIVGIPAFFDYIGLGETLKTVIAAGSWVVLLALFAFFLAFAYRYAPDRRNAKWTWVSWGAGLAAILWVVASALFSWYATEFGNYNKTYGSMGAIIVLMMWFYITSYVVLLGGEVNSELEHQTKKDSTAGAPKPMGARGAKMADQVGETSEQISKS
ncbi:MAG TPA: YihY/virulence factor BrkB family protein [Bacteriovoracaceae bacterium]|nr:YihY/virulence factor BrkB family protein [Bacteriovoracaceae bacterium]